MILQPPIILVTTLLLLTIVNGDTRVHILSENLDQTLTSTTLQWVMTDGRDYHLLKNAVIAAYQTVDDPHSSEIPENGNLENDIFRQEPIYICRARVTGMWVSGQLRPKQHVCVVSYFKTQEAKQFEVLINIENSGRLSWVGKNQFTNLPAGIVTSSDSNIINVQQQKPLFVARKAVKSDNKTGALTHYVGAFNPTENLGVFRVVDQNNTEITFEEGELLVETEPVAYRFRNIKFLKLGRRTPKQKRILAHAILKNEIQGLQKVESVMSYNYSYYLNWGKGHGLQKGLPYTLTWPNGSNFKGLWEIKEEGERVETVPVEMYLEENTGVNITLIGYLSDTEEPYTATVVSLYKDKEEREITIKDIKREKKMLDVTIEKSQIYFLNNDSFVPTTPPPTTTTPTTTTTTRTTSTKTTSTTQEVTPIVEPEVVMNKKQVLQAADKKDDSVGMMSDEHSIRSAPQEVKSRSSTTSTSTLLSFGTVLLIALRVT